MGHSTMDMGASGSGGDVRTGAAASGTSGGVQGLGGAGSGMMSGGRGGVGGADISGMGGMKRKVNSRTGSNPLYASEMHEPKRFDVLETYEQASQSGQNYKSLEYSIFTGGIDTGINFGELSVTNSSLMAHEVIDSISGEKKSGIGMHSSIHNQNIQQDKLKFSERFLGPFCQSQLNDPKISEFYPQIQEDYISNQSQ